MNIPKVSIITPCYNGEKYLVPYLDSLLTQNYSNVEYFFVDDGSFDNTKNIFYSYIEKLENKGWEVKYIYKENGGAASAINEGLKLFTGKYLMIPDSDDILLPEYILSNVEFMEQHPEFGITYCVCDVVNEYDKNKIIWQMRITPNNDMFNNIIKNENWMWMPIGYFMKTEAFLDTHPNRKIPECKGGQNCQMQLPIFYKYKCGFIDKVLAHYVERKNSHMRTADKAKVKRYLEFTKIWIKTICSTKQIPICEKTILCMKVIYRDFKKILKYIIKLTFSLENEYKDNSKHKILTLFGIKLKKRMKYVR